MQWFYLVIAGLMLEYSDMSVIKNMQSGKYIQSSALTTFKNVGPQMCIRKCARYSGCTAINYKWTQLYCELLNISSTDLETSTIADSEFSYSEISSSEVLPLDICWPNPCAAGTKCVVTQNDTHVCIKYATYPTYPVECGDVGPIQSRIYTIYPLDSQVGVDVYCDMAYDGGGWTTIQKRFDGSVHFNGSWYDYKKGFGSANGEFWIGNDIIHQLTAHSQHKLRIQLTDWENVTKYANYGEFTVADEHHKYRLRVDSYTGDAGDGFTVYENNSFFSTYERIHDTCGNSSSGPRPHGGGWWFDCLQQGNLNSAKYYHGQQTGLADGLSWYPWHEYNQSMKTTTMTIKNN